MSVEHLLYWNYCWLEMGDTPSTLANFETGLNEHRDPPVLGAFEAAHPEVANLAFSLAGKTLALVSQAALKDISPALLEGSDTGCLRPMTNGEPLIRLTGLPTGQLPAGQLDLG